MKTANIIVIFQESDYSILYNLVNESVFDTFNKKPEEEKLSYIMQLTESEENKIIFESIPDLFKYVCENDVTLLSSYETILY